MSITPIQIIQDTVKQIASSSNSILIERQFKVGQQMSWLKVVKIAGAASPNVAEMNNNGVHIFQLDPAREIIESTVLVDVYVMCNDGGLPGDYGKLVIWEDYRSFLNQELNVDETSNAVNTIDSPHHEMHEGDHYFGKTAVPFDGGNDETQYFMFRTPNTSTRAHAKASFYASVEFEITIYEGATVSADGTPFPVFNNDRDMINGNELEPFAAPTVTDLGTALWNSKTGSGRTSTGVSNGFNYEIIAKTNTVYIFELIKREVTTGYIDVDFWWYEHVPSN